jgi:hypothetical protein
VQPRAALVDRGLDQILLGLAEPRAGALDQFFTPARQVSISKATRPASRSGNQPRSSLPPIRSSCSKAVDHEEETVDRDHQPQRIAPLHCDGPSGSDVLDGRQWFVRDAVLIQVAALIINFALWGLAVFVLELAK